MVALRGCMLPIKDEIRMQNLEQDTISRFVHKLGNHFQLLNLVITSRRKWLSDSREADVFVQTLEKLIELTRTFSDYSQSPTCVTEVDFLELLTAVAVSRGPSFLQKGVTFEEKFAASARGIVIQGDSYLLELALAGVVQNALEATEPGGLVVFKAEAKQSDDKLPVARIHVIDSGCGIDSADLERVKFPFFSTKKNHDGLGLSMATRFVEMQGGLLEIDTAKGLGSDVSITLPARFSKLHFDR